MRWLRDVLAVGFRPRTTMRRVLDHGRAPVLPLVVAATISTMIKDVSVTGLAHVLRSQTAVTAAMIAGAIVCGAILLVGLFYGLSWMAVYAGRMLEGHATPAQVRAAMAWGLVPMIWLLLVRVPVAFLRAPTELRRMGGINLTLPSSGTLAGALVLVVVNALGALWYVYVASETLGEANQFSGWRGLGTLAMVGVTPFVIALAAILALK
ncbi:MAG: YIP1 family protein [Thermoanaerobaculia bacterium]